MATTPQTGIDQAPQAPRSLMRRAGLPAVAATLALAAVNVMPGMNNKDSGESAANGNAPAEVAAGLDKVPNTMGVKAGETMWDKAEQQLDSQGLDTDPVSVDARTNAIKALNPEVEPTELQPGTRIVVPEQDGPDLP